MLAVRTRTHSVVGVGGDDWKKFRRPAVSSGVIPQNEKGPGRGCDAPEASCPNPGKERT